MAEQFNKNSVREHAIEPGNRSARVLVSIAAPRAAGADGTSSGSVDGGGTPSADVPVAAAGSAPARDAIGSEPCEPPDYVLADLPKDALVYKGEKYWFRPFMAVVAGYTFFEQNDPSIVQVSTQDDSQDLRAARFGF